MKPSTPPPYDKNGKHFGKGDFIKIDCEDENQGICWAKIMSTPKWKKGYDKDAVQYKLLHLKTEFDGDDEDNEDTAGETFDGAYWRPKLSKDFKKLSKKEGLELYNECLARQI